MVIKITNDEIERVRRDIIERGKIEAPDENVIVDELPLPPRPAPKATPTTVAVKSAVPPLDPDSPQARQNRKLADRLLRGRIKGAQNGKHQSGPSPYGYRRRGDDKLLEPDPYESEVVRLIFREYLRLRSMKRLIEFLSEKNITTRRQKEWSRAGVSWILKNDTYVGRVHFGEVKARGVHIPIVSQIIFHKVGKMIRLNDKRSPKTSTPPSDVPAPTIHLTHGPSAP